MFKPKPHRTVCGGESSNQKASSRRAGRLDLYFLVANIFTKLEVGNKGRKIMQVSTQPTWYMYPRTAGFSGLENNSVVSRHSQNIVMITQGYPARTSSPKLDQFPQTGGKQVEEAPPRAHG